MLRFIYFLLILPSPYTLPRKRPPPNPLPWSAPVGIPQIDHHPWGSLIIISCVQRKLQKKAAKKRQRQKKDLIKKMDRMQRAGASSGELKRIEDIIKRIDDEKETSNGFSDNPPILPCCLAHLTSSLSTSSFGELPINYMEANRRDPVQDPKSWRHFGYSFLPHYINGAELKDLLHESSMITSKRKPLEIGGNVSQFKLFTRGKSSSKRAEAYLVCEFLSMTFR